MQTTTLKSANIYALFITLLSFAIFTPLSFAHAVTATNVSSPYMYTYSVDGSLVEAGSITDSTSGYWWVNSGGRLLLSSGLGSTIHGSLPSTDAWRVLYAANNPTDTDNG